MGQKHQFYKTLAQWHQVYTETAYMWRHRADGFYICGTLRTLRWQSPFLLVNVPSYLMVVKYSMLLGLLCLQHGVSYKQFKRQMRTFYLELDSTVLCDCLISWRLRSLLNYLLVHWLILRNFDKFISETVKIFFVRQIFFGTVVSRTEYWMMPWPTAFILQTCRFINYVLTFKRKLR